MQGVILPLARKKPRCKLSHFYLLFRFAVPSLVVAAILWVVYIFLTTRMLCEARRIPT